MVFQLSLNEGQKYCRKHSAILSIFIKLPFVIKIFVLSIFEVVLHRFYCMRMLEKHVIFFKQYIVVAICVGSTQETSQHD